MQKDLSRRAAFARTYIRRAECPSAAARLGKTHRIDHRRARVHIELSRLGLVEVLQAIDQPIPVEGAFHGDVRQSGIDPDEEFLDLMDPAK